MIVVKSKIGYPKIRKFEISEIQLRMAGTKNGGSDNNANVAEKSYSVKIADSVDEEKAD